MSNWRGEDDDNEGDEELEEEDEDSEFYQTKKDALIFALDASDAMFASILDDGLEPFYLGLKSIVNTYCEKIIAGGGDSVGVVFYNTKEKKNNFDFEHVYIFRDLDEPDAKSIKDMETIVRDRSISDFGTSNQKARLDEVMWTCQHLFSHLSQITVGFRRILIFTNDENPSSSDHVKKCAEKAYELRDNDITMTPIFLKKREIGFNPSLFWNKIDLVDVDTDTGRRGYDYIDRIKDLTETVKYKEYKKRTMASVEMSLGEDIKFGVSIYTMVHKEIKPSSINLQGGQNNILKTNTKYIDVTLGTPLAKNDIYQYWMYGGQKAIFSPTEVTQIKKLVDKGIKILGFKPRKSLKDHHNYRNSLFLYPNDELIQGSSTAMSALLKKMIEMDKIGICRFLDRENSSMSYCALVPQREVVVDNRQVVPPGFNCIFLPFAEGLRSIDPIGIKPEVDDKQVLKAKKMISKLEFKFNSNSFDNPSLQYHYSVLQALALRHSEPEPFQDSTLPDVNGFNKYKQFIDDFKESVYPFDYEPEIKKSTYKPRAKKETKNGDDDDQEDVAPKKRKKTVGDDDEDPAPKKKAPAKKSVKKEPKQEDVQGGDDEEEEEITIDMIEEVKTGHVSKLTLDILKQFCRAYELPVSGKKDALIQRIHDYLESKGKLN